MPTKPKSHYELGREEREREARRQYDRDRGRADDGFLDSAEWKALRVVVLNRDEGLCQRCRSALATDVDHVLDRADRPDLRLDPDNCQSLCKRCHSSKTRATVNYRNRLTGKNIKNRVAGQP
jgi:5-methylcytosine-specific restriction protein A